MKNKEAIKLAEEKGEVRLERDVTLIAFEDGEDIYTEIDGKFEVTGREIYGYNYWLHFERYNFCHSVKNVYDLALTMVLNGYYRRTEDKYDKKNEKK
jgi:hypothetical protein